ncbi:hypothetical protein TYRP_011949 [Tyrophagus putrescentiae]|nr:hypothetical protein TYRP_011949 [Tyrophagus putrescentiae]
MAFNRINQDYVRGTTTTQLIELSECLTHLEELYEASNRARQTLTEYMHTREQTRLVFAQWMQSVDVQDEEVLEAEAQFGNFMDRMHDSISEYSRLLSETREVMSLLNERIANLRDAVVAGLFQLMA